MKTLKIIGWIILGITSSQGQNPNQPAGDITDLIQTEFPGNNRPPDWDTRPPAAGKIRLYAEILLKEAKEEIAGQMGDVPEGAEGKGSALYAKTTQWLQEVDHILLDGSRINLLKLNPLHAEVFVSANHRGAVDPSVMSVVAEINNLSKALIYNMADFLSENPNPSVKQHGEMIDLFCTSSFFQEGEWENEPLSIDAAGVFVTNATNSVAKLETKSLEEIEIFLGGSKDNSFFERYEAPGDGMGVLKTKYAANKVAIQAKFAEVLAHAAQLEAQK